MSSRQDYRVDVDPEASNNPHSAAIRFVGTGRRVLEVGCWSGHVTEHLVARHNSVVGIELDPEAAGLARAFAERVHVADVDLVPLTHLESGPFDVVMLCDVLEHLRRPGDVLAQAVALLAEGGRVVVSVPSVAHVDVRMMLLQGRWEYQDDGLLDRTHIRWFTRRTLRELLAEAGLVAVGVERVVTPFGSSNLAFDRAAVPPELVAFVTADPEANTLQYVVDAVTATTPNVDDALAEDLPVSWPASLGAAPALAANAQIADLERERDALRAEVEAWRNSRLVRAAAPARRLYARLRAARR